jgi:hypothetical protein
LRALEVAEAAAQLPPPPRAFTSDELRALL